MRTWTAVVSTLHGRPMSACVRCGAARRPVAVVVDGEAGVHLVHHPELQRRMALCSRCTVDGWGRCGACGNWAIASWGACRPDELLDVIAQTRTRDLAHRRSLFASCDRPACRAVVSAWSGGNFRSPIRFAGRVTCYRSAIAASHAHDPNAALDVCATETLLRILEDDLAQARHRTRAQ